VRLRRDGVLPAGTHLSEDDVLATLSRLPTAGAPDDEFRRATRERLVAMAAVRTPAVRGEARP
jgi:hypothetical protein